MSGGPTDGGVQDGGATPVPVPNMEPVMIVLYADRSSLEKESTLARLTALVGTLEPARDSESFRYTNGVWVLATSLTPAEQAVVRTLPGVRTIEPNQEITFPEASPRRPRRF